MKHRLLDCYVEVRKLGMLPACVPLYRVYVEARIWCPEAGKEFEHIDRGWIHVITCPLCRKQLILRVVGHTCKLWEATHRDRWLLRLLNPEYRDNEG